MADASAASFQIDVPKFEAASVRLAAGPLVLEIGRIVLSECKGLARLVDGKPRLQSLQAAGAELENVKIQVPPQLPPLAQAQVASGAWTLAPLATADGTIRAQIVDAQLFFDADVTVPIRQGQIRFSDATVEHVGPDSRMGVSRMGFYVEAPNGRSYLYQFAATPVAGVEFEKRGALPWSGDRGSLRLQEFAESLLRQGPVGAGQGFTEQARLLLARTALSGEVRLADGKLALPGLQAELVGRAQGRNTVRLHARSVGQGISVDVPLVSVRNLAWTA